MFKIHKNIDKINWFKPIDYHGDKTRGHNKKIRKQIIKKCDKRFRFFTNRIADEWNKLPENAINAISINSFKNKLDNIIFQKAETVLTDSLDN